MQILKILSRIFRIRIYTRNELEFVKHQAYVMGLKGSYDALEINEMNIKCVLN